VLFALKLKHEEYKLELLSRGWVQFGINLKYVWTASNPASLCAEKSHCHMAVSINKLHLISKYSFFLRRGRKLGSYCQSASWKTALKHTTLCTRNYYKYNKKFIIIFDSRTFTTYAELFETHHTGEKQRELYGKFYLTKLNSINIEFSGIALLLDNTLPNKKCINCLSRIITTTYIKSTAHYMLFISLSWGNPTQHHCT